MPASPVRWSVPAMVAIDEPVDGRWSTDLPSDRRADRELDHRRLVGGGGPGPFHQRARGLREGGRERFAEQYVEPLVAEARKLGIGHDELMKMIDSSSLGVGRDLG
jgi:hypothetical protein